MARPVVLNLKAHSLHEIGGYAATGLLDARMSGYVHNFLFLWLD